MSFLVFVLKMMFPINLKIWQYYFFVLCFMSFVICKLSFLNFGGKKGHSNKQIVEVLHTISTSIKEDIFYPSYIIHRIIPMVALTHFTLFTYILASAYSLDKQHIFHIELYHIFFSNIPSYVQPTLSHEHPSFCEPHIASSTPYTCRNFPCFSTSSSMQSLQKVFASMFST